jgi:hypothetical protein
VKILKAGSALLGALLGVFVFTGTASAGSIGLVPNEGCISYAGVYFCDRDLRSAGTGVIDPFLQVQRDGSQADGTPDTYSSGFNTNADGYPQPGGVAATNDMSDAHTNALLGSDIGFAIPPSPPGDGTTQFAVFTVDINQQGAQGSLADILSLNHFELFDCGLTNNYTTLAGCTSIFNLFASGDWANFDYRNHTGSGAGDIDIFIPASLLSGLSTHYIALLDGWGCGAGGYTCPATDPTNSATGLFADNDGFQEWLRTGGPLTGGTGSGGGSGQPVVPEPASLLLLGSGLGAAALKARKRKKQQTQA